MKRKSGLGPTRTCNVRPLLTFGRCYDVDAAQAQDDS